MKEEWHIAAHSLVEGLSAAGESRLPILEGDFGFWTRSRHYGQRRKQRVPPSLNVETARSRHAIVPFTRQPSHRRGIRQSQSDAGN